MKYSKPGQLVLIASLLVFTSLCEAQEKDATPTTLTTPSRVQLAATYWEATNGKESPVIVLLHSEGGNRKKWEPIAGGLQKKGYAVLSVDLRKHGESPGAAEDDTDIQLKPADYSAMITDDMEAVKSFLIEKHHASELNIRKTGLVAIGNMGAVAINAGWVDWMRKPYPDGPPSARTPRGQDVQTIVLISPNANVKGVKTNDGMKQTKIAGIKYLVVVGAKDKGKKTSAEKILKSLKAGLRKGTETEQILTYSYPSKLNGEDLVARESRSMLTLLTEFHDTKLKPVAQPWRDRHNRLNK